MNLQKRTKKAAKMETVVAQIMNNKTLIFTARMVQMSLNNHKTTRKSLMYKSRFKKRILINSPLKNQRKSSRLKLQKNKFKKYLQKLISSQPLLKLNIKLHQVVKKHLQIWLSKQLKEPKMVKMAKRILKMLKFNKIETPLSRTIEIQ